MKLVAGSDLAEAVFLHSLPSAEQVEIVVEQRRVTEIRGVRAQPGGPRSPITAQTLRQIPLGRLLDLALLQLSGVQSDAPPDPRGLSSGRDHYRLMAMMAGGGEVPPEPPPGPAERPGKPGHGDLHYARWAEWYVEAINAGIRNPTRYLSETRAPRQSNRYAYARTALIQARKRGLLTTIARGRAGGELTPKALELLRADDGLPKA